MKVLIVLALTVVACKAAFLFSTGCSSDADCSNDGCCHKSLFTSSCQNRIGKMHRCPLKVTTSTTCTSLCATGLQCVDESNTDLAIEPGYNTENYGRCMTPTAAVVSTGLPVTQTTSSA